jgi:hypothetical protein
MHLGDNYDQIRKTLNTLRDQMNALWAQLDSTDISSEEAKEARDTATFVLADLQDLANAAKIKTTLHA